jgi:hypothetical protein
MKISLVVPNRDNLKYFKWSYDSIRKNQGNHEIYICSAADACKDGTVEHYEELARNDDKFKYIVNEGPDRLGHTILYDRIVNELVDTDVFMIWHCDMYLCPKTIDYIEKYIQPGTIVSLTRIEPPLHPPGPEKIVQSFGNEPEEFNEVGLLKWFNDTRMTRKDKTTEGIFAPWAIYKSDFQSIGGHDDLYAPQSKEDSDVFNRLLLNGYKFIQTWEGCVYHMTCRGSRYNPTLTTVGKESDEWLAQNNKSARNFIRKWGHFVKHNDAMKPIVPKRYDVGFVVKNCDAYKLALLEPWCDSIYTDVPYELYINVEQKNTKFDLKKKLKRYEDPKTNDVIVEFDANKITNNSFEFFNMLQLMLEDSGQTGELEFDIFRLKISKLEDFSKNLIDIKDDWYNNKLTIDRQ